MSVEYDIKKGRIYDSDGNERLVYRIQIPLFEGCDKINDFYERIGSFCEIFCKEDLIKYLGSIGRARYHYELLCRVCHTDELLVSVLTRARLSGEGSIISQHFYALTWSLTEQDMLPPKLLFKKRRKKDSQRFDEKKEVFLYEGALKMAEHADIDRFFI